MRVAIVGSGGFIGGRLAAALRDGGHDVCAISSRSDAFESASGLLRELSPYPEPIDALVYLSQSPHYRDVPRQAPHLWSVNVVSAIRAAEWARRCGARRIIHASTGNVYQHSFAPHRETDPVRREDWYPLSKRHAEEALQLLDGVSVSSARLFGVYGPGQRLKLVPNLVTKILADEEIELWPHPEKGPDGGLHLSMMYVDDVVRSMLRLLEADGPAILNVAGPQVLSVRTIAETIAARLGREPRFRAMDAPRQFDLIADVSVIAGLIGDAFTSFATGIEATLRAATPAGD